MYYITLMRHGRSLADDEKKHEGRYDSPLTEIGEQQARNTAQRFISEGVIFNKIIASPLKRAHRTAEIINTFLNTILIDEPLLMEHDNGILAGMKYEEVNKKYPLPDFLSPFRYYPEKTGENPVLLHSRAGQALNAIINHGPGCYLIVTHGGILNSILRNMLGINYPVNESGVVFSFNDNGFINILYDEKIHKTTIVRMQPGV